MNTNFYVGKKGKILMAAYATIIGVVSGSLSYACMYRLSRGNARFANDALFQVQHGIKPS